MIRMPPRRILAAVDPSIVSLDAWRAAKAIAERFDASLEAVYCEPLPAAVGGEVGPTPFEGRAARVVEVLKRRLGPGTRLHAARGDPAPVIIRLAHDLAFDLVVLGTHRRRGALRVVMGSVAEAVARDCPCPVLVLPGRMPALRSILAPVHDADYARRGLLAAGLVARAFHARLHALNVVVDPIFDPRPEALLRARIAELPEEVRRESKPIAETRTGAAIPEILKAARGRDLVVLTAHRKSLLDDWVLGTTAERVIRHSPVPVLTVPSRA